MDPLKIFISADMEGVTGVIDWDETTGPHTDYQYFRKIMTEEVNAAIQGAIALGATDIVVRDAHGTARNIIPDLLNENARLLRAWSVQPFSMMEGLDSSFDAVCFVGYHAKAMTSNGTLAHTMSGAILDLRVNGLTLPEFGWNALIAGYYSVPVIFLSGDEAICQQARELIPEIETVAVKQGIGEACLNIHPRLAQRKIQEGVQRAIQQLPAMRPFIVAPPFEIEIDFKKKDRATHAAWYPGAVKKGEFTISYTSDDFLDCLRFFHFVH